MRLRLIAAADITRSLLRRHPAIAGLSAAAALVTSTDARACGGCFHPPVISQGESTVVTGHRMAFSTSPAQSVLWDQIQYSGDPKDFAWVLPVRKGAVVEESNDAWFETLESATTVQVHSPVLECPEITRPNSGGCAASLAGAAFDEGGGGANAGGPPVTVVHQGTVGPYETVTLSTMTPGALNEWLTAHGYNVDADIQPIIDAYVSEGFDFIALRLQPNKGVREMKPVRVVSPGADVTLPLRMVAAGTGADVAITLFTITESRQAVKDYKNVTVAPQGLIWDFKAETSNYADIRKSTLAQNAGLTWLTVLAQKGGLLSPLPGLGYGYGDYGYYDGYGGSIASTYINQGYRNGEASDTSCLDAIGQIADSSSLVVDPCPAGVPADDPSCGQIAPGQIDARTLACGTLDDLAVALDGLHPSDVWITRLEADLPRLALAHDLVLEPAADQAAVSNQLQAPIGINSDGLCPTSVPPLSMIAPGYGKERVKGRLVDHTPIFGYTVLGLLVTGIVVRRRRRSRSH